MIAGGNVFFDHGETVRHSLQIRGASMLNVTGATVRGGDGPAEEARP